MESRIRSLFLKANITLVLSMCLSFGMNSFAADPVEIKNEQIIIPELERREIVQAKIDTEDWEVGIQAGALSIEDFGVNPVVGLRVAYHVTEDFFAELNVGGSTASESSVEVLGGGLRLLTDDQREYLYYNLSIGYNLFAGESFFGKHAFNSDIYVTLGIGNTNFADDDHFTYTIGAGYRFIPKDWLALHFDVRDHIFNSDILGADKVTHNLEASIGITFFF